MSTHAVACFFEVVVHSQNRLIDGLFLSPIHTTRSNGPPEQAVRTGSVYRALDNGKRKSATRESLADDFKVQTYMSSRADIIA